MYMFQVKHHRVKIALDFTTNIVGFGRMLYFHLFCRVETQNIDIQSRKRFRKSLYISNSIQSLEVCTHRDAASH